ncbi:MAG: HAD hydrolase family protein, partial [Ruminococcus sp.]|nr:HAD hydrolase family protein [Ruminococcus sp.]
MVRFFTDIDNTLLYSHRRDIGSEKVVVEYINGNIQSYMTERSYACFTALNGVETIPVTTRIKSQYDRLAELTAKLNVRYAIICNGGILLENGEIQQDWLEQTYEMTEPAQAQLAKAAEIMAQLSDREVHKVERIMDYVVCDDAENAGVTLKNSLDSDLVTVFRDNRKVYCVPSVINKGSAVRRFIGKYGACTSIGAGDGEQDISLLEAVDIP